MSAATTGSGGGNNTSSTGLPVLSIPCAVSCTFVKWFVALHDRVEKSQRLCDFKSALNGQVTTVLAPIEGRITALHAVPGQLCPRGRTLWYLQHNTLCLQPIN